jgi:hypothetical protein
MLPLSCPARFHDGNDAHPTDRADFPLHAVACGKAGNVSESAPDVFHQTLRENNASAKLSA